MALWRRIRDRFRGQQLQFKSMPPAEPDQPQGFWYQGLPPESEPEEDEGDLGAYARKSPPKGADVIDGQFDQLELEFGERIAGRFADDGVSGKVHWTKRPGLSELLYAIKDGRLRGICFVSLDRLCRPEDVLEQEEVLAFVWQHGGRVLSLREGELLPDGAADLSRKVIRLGLANFNQQWRLENEERRRRGRQRRLRQGHFNGGRTMNGGLVGDGRKYGYRKTRWFDPSRRQFRFDWEPIAEEMEVVWLIKDRFAAKGPCWAELVRELNGRGVPTVTGALWTRCTVRTIAMRPEQAVREGSRVVGLDAGHPAVEPAVVRATARRRGG